MNKGLFLTQVLAGEKWFKLRTQENTSSNLGKVFNINPPRFFCLIQLTNLFDLSCSSNFTVTSPFDLSS